MKRVILLVLLSSAMLPFQQSVPQYIDSSECASCHVAIATKYQQTGMGRSFSTVTNVDSGSLYHTASDRYYTMSTRDGHAFQRRYQIGPDGNQINVIEESIDYVLGSGNHSRTYLHLNPQKKLVELPLAWYAENGGTLGMNPGYDWQHHSDFRRKLTNECLFCHNGFVQQPTASGRADSEAIVAGKIAAGIDCQRCHGPGSEHARAARTAGTSRETVRAAIVNPAKLSPERNLEVCMQCHLESTSAPLPYAVRRVDRGVFSYGPGEPLADYMIHFDRTKDNPTSDHFEIAGSAYRLRLSQCFIKSAGSMTCTTCHDPHDIPRGDAATQHYTGVCQGCHEAQIKSLVAAERHPSSSDCVSCHMPKRRTDDAVHVVMTDHYIQRTTPARDLLAPIAENHSESAGAYKGEVVVYYPPTLPPSPDNELYLAVAQVTQGSNLKKGIQRLKAAIDKSHPRQGEFYFELGKAYLDDNSPALAAPMFQQALDRMGDYWPALHRLGLALSKLGQSARAITVLEKASRLSTEPGPVLNDLGMAYRRAGMVKQAVAALRKATEVDPDFPGASNNLAGMLLEGGDTAGAEMAFREAIRIQPDLAAAHDNLARILAQRGDLRQAEFHYQKAIDQAIAGEISAVDGHMALGQIEMQRGRREQALLHFQKAAESSDPAIKRQAEDAIRRLP